MGPIAAELLILLPGLVTREGVVWLLAGYHRGCGQSSIVIYACLRIQSLMVSQCLLNESIDISS